MPVQGTFTLLPGVGRAPDVNNGSIRPMTSKQVKKAHKAANRQPKLSRAEQRRLELAEQERIRKEFEKERSAARARAARERKKQKELADKEKKRRNGQPLVAPRPSQETLSRFMWGNGSGLKRDGRGTAVAPAPMTAVAEEPEEPEALVPPENSNGGESDDSVAIKQDPSLDTGIDDANGQMEEPDQEPDQAHALHATTPRPPGDAQPELRPGVQQDEEPPQPDNDHSDQLDQAGSPHTTPSRPNPGGAPEPQPEPEPGVRDDEPPLSVNDHFGQLNQADLPRPITPRPSISTAQPGPELEAQVDEELLKAAASGGSFILGSSDMIDDESLLELTESFERRPVIAEQKTATPDPVIDLPDLGAITQLFDDMNDDYDYETLEDEALKSNGGPSEEFELPQQGVQPGPQQGLQLDDRSSTEAIPKDQASPQPQRSQRRKFERKVSSFFDSELDDELLLQLELPGEIKESEPAQPVGEKPADELQMHKSPPADKQTITSASRCATPPSPVVRRQQPPPSTQAILLNLDDYLPSSTQLALELEDDILEEEPGPIMNQPRKQVEKQPPVPRWGATPSPVNIQTARPIPTTPQTGGPPIQQQKRFFSSSGSNESLHLALHLSRRSAALEGIRRNERRRLEAGLLRFQKRATNQQSMHEQKRPQIYHPAVASQGGRDTPVQNMTRTSRTMTNEEGTGPAMTSTSVPTKETQETDRGQPSAEPAVAIKEDITNKENIRPSRGDDELLGGDLPAASQETEYGGAWIDDIGSDLVF